ncbi:MAG: hypothetical protein HYY01_12305 [Chloroflexi bacterium]|nr:hypothetical protein [Chloroflexota bacterium]
MNTRLRHKLALALLGLALTLGTVACGEKGPPPPPKIGEWVWGQNMALRVEKKDTHPFLVYSRNRGSVSSVNAGESRLSVLLDNQSAPVTLTVNADSRIIRDGAEVPLDSVAAKDIVEKAAFAQDTLVLSRLELQSGVKYWKIVPPEGQEFVLVWVEVYQEQAGNMQLNPVSDRVELRDKDGNKYVPATITGGEVIESSPSGYYIPLFTEPVSLPPKNSISGWLAFIVPKGTPLQEFVWDEIDRITVRLS